jgi:hypothetical protein
MIRQLVEISMNLSRLKPAAKWTHRKHGILPRAFASRRAGVSRGFEPVIGFGPKKVPSLSLVFEYFLHKPINSLK